MNENRKTPGFAEKLNEEQISQLCEWLIDHTYKDVAELVAEEPPEGFGIKVSVPTICRFATEYSEEIAGLRADKMFDALSEYRDTTGYRDIYFTAEVDDATTNALREHAFYKAMQGSISTEEILRLSRACLALRKLQSSQPTRGVILMARQSAEEHNCRVRAGLEKIYGPPDQHDCFPVESENAKVGWVFRQKRNALKAEQKNQDGVQPSKPA